MVWAPMWGYNITEKLGHCKACIHACEGYTNWVQFWVAAMIFQQIGLACCIRYLFKILGEIFIKSWRIDPKTLPIPYQYGYPLWFLIQLRPDLFLMCPYFFNNVQLFSVCYTEVNTTLMIKSTNKRKVMLANNVAGFPVAW